MEVIIPEIRWCDKCKHYLPGGKPKCKAFPEGIPIRIFAEAEKKHKKPIEGQTGDYVFENDEPPGYGVMLVDFLDESDEPPEHTVIRKD